ncbi:MBL fold metallo-hydrolase [Microbulbifer salipaludis]|uniref:MBL fold metallo-hydrolase n=1 Tax=Microbulbifer salipaludis TaxID=187980 RepID=A0ABS3E2S9_9GAMM|nr:alkyl sulfatase dimerization domain-containing protein [Microbulbifer salipaludis]MBN8429523.1 MBL fold metallo-hydrolase [Microbulbifer salipaludis]
MSVKTNALGLVVLVALFTGCSKSTDDASASDTGGSVIASAQAQQATEQLSAHSDYTFTTEQKDASEYTRKLNEAVYGELDFDDKTAQENVERGFIAPLLNNGDIEGVYPATKLNFMQGKKAPPEVNPSLWRHAQLVNRGGLFKVIDRVYQVRGQALVNLTIIEGDTGIILYDVEYTPATLVKSIELYQQERGKKPLKGVIISHSHADHFGGFNGIIDAGLATKEDFTSGKIPLIAPEGFVEESVSENVMGGNIMARRAGYQYGNVLPAGPKGKITAALGAAVADGQSGLPIPNKTISKDGEKVTIDGVEFEFYVTPHAEAPSEMVFYIPQWKAMSMAEELNHLQHNIYTLRGAKIRDASLWASYLAEAVARWGDEVEVNFGPHTWPVWGNENVVRYLKAQRDLYQSIYNTALRYANYGYRPDDIAEYAALPDSVFKQWYNRPYYGHTKNNLKSTYVRNFGWFNGNPTELAKYPDAERGKRYVKAIGGEERVLALALESFKAGDYRFTVDILNNVVAYNGKNTNVNLLMADAFEQLGYQEENTLYRNLYLSGASELRAGGNIPNKLGTASPEVLGALPPSLMLTYLSMLVDQKKAEGAGNFTINLKLKGEGDYALDMNNGVLTSVADHQTKNADVTLEIAKLDLLAAMSGKAKLKDLLSADKASITGNQEVLSKLTSVMGSKMRNDMNLVLPLQDANKIQ